MIVEIKSKTPKVHIELCSVIDFYSLEILDDSIYDKYKRGYYGHFKVVCNKDALDLLKQFEELKIKKIKDV